MFETPVPPPSFLPSSAGLLGALLANDQALEFRRQRAQATFPLLSPRRDTPNTYKLNFIDELRNEIDEWIKL